MVGRSALRWVNHGASPQPMSIAFRSVRRRKYSVAATAMETLRRTSGAGPIFARPRYQRSKYAWSYLFCTRRKITTFGTLCIRLTDTQRILDSIRRLVRLLRLTDRAAQSELGLSGAQLFVLHELGKTPSLSLCELADRTRTDQSSVSVVVTRLVEAGYLTRDRDKRDARRLVLNLTKSGRAIAEKSPPAAQERILEALDRIAAADRRRFADIFSRVIDELGESRGSAPMIFEEETNRRQSPKK
jgi:DNA-binding MarR family transcriptional regulator